MPGHRLRLDFLWRVWSRITHQRQNPLPGVLSDVPRTRREARAIGLRAKHARGGTATTGTTRPPLLLRVGGGGLCYQDPICFVLGLAAALPAGAAGICLAAPAVLFSGKFSFTVFRRVRAPPSLRYSAAGPRSYAASGRGAGGSSATTPTITMQGNGSAV